MSEQAFGGGLCGLDRYSFPLIRESKPLLYKEHTHLELAAYKALLGAECKNVYRDVDFSGYMHVRRYPDLGMTRGEYHLALFSGEFAYKEGGSIFIYVVMQTETKPGVKFRAKLFARSFATDMDYPDIWMNESSAWEFVDRSLLQPVTVMSTV